MVGVLCEKFYIMSIIRTISYRKSQIEKIKTMAKVGLLAPNPPQKPKSKREYYNTYISSPAWKLKREEALKFYGKKCNRCPCTVKLQVHHKNYTSLYNEKMDDLEVLCGPCHDKVHMPKRLERMATNLLRNSKSKRRRSKRNKRRKR